MLRDCSGRSLVPLQLWQAAHPGSQLEAQNAQWFGQPRIHAGFLRRVHAETPCLLQPARCCCGCVKCRCCLGTAC